MKKWILIILPILIFAGLMVYLNRSDEKEKFANPEVGDLYVFDNFMRDYGLISENVFKINSISKDSIYFLIPKTTFPFAGGIDHDVISKVRRLDSKNEMFTNQNISISKKDILKYRENASLTNKLKNPDAIMLTGIY